MKLEQLKQFKKTGNFTLSSGKKSKYYYDLKEAMGDPVLLHQICHDLLLENPERVNADLYIGIEYGGVPLAICCSLMTGTPYAILRKNKKRHGTLSKIEGYKGKGKVILFDDVLTTGNSIKKAVKFLKHKEYEILKTVTIMERK